MAWSNCFLSVWCSLITFSWCRGEVKFRGQGGHLFSDRPKKTHTFVEDVEHWLPDKVRQIPFSCYRGEVKSVSANQRQGRPSWFSDLLEKNKLVDDAEYLLPVKFCQIPFKGQCEKLTTVGRTTDDGHRIVEDSRALKTKHEADRIWHILW